MLRKRLSRRRPADGISRLRGWWISLCFFWHTRNKTPWVVAAILLWLIGSLAALSFLIDSNRVERRELTCLALNVYYEARGEPLEGMYAVAEVTMNRVASHRYPRTVCEVVYDRKWDRLRKRYVSAFSWTEFDIVPHPEGSQWRLAREAAETVYFRRRPPALAGALHYHASYIMPSWAKEQQPITRIGSHIFYR